MGDKSMHGYTIASKWKRLVATVTESVIFILVFFGIHLILGGTVDGFFENDYEFMDFVYSAISAIVVGALFYPRFGGNLGHKIFDLKVISEETGEDYKTAKEGAIRELLKNVLSFLVIPIIWILWDKKNQNLYDKLTKTLVVERNANS